MRHYFDSEYSCFLSEKCQYDAVDVREIFARYTVDMMSCCYFGFNTNALTEPKSNLLEFCKSIMKPSVVSLWMHFLRSNYPELFYWLVTKLPTSRYQQTIEDMIKMADELRKSGSLYSKDLVQLMLDLRDLSQQKAYADKNSNDGSFWFWKYITITGTHLKKIISLKVLRQICGI